jgi:SAM-dependent methyltransferase
MTYNRAFYDMIRPGIQASAGPVLDALYKDVLGMEFPRRVLDVGCGEGWWASEWAARGAEVVGVDSGEIPPYALAPGFGFRSLDLMDPTWADGLGRFDLVSCLEVGEHLPSTRAAGLVAELGTLTDTVLWSAAIPGQGGTGHLNEAAPRIWADLFEAEGFSVSGALRWMIWEDSRIENWYRQNLLYATRHPDDEPWMFTGPHTKPLHVVHPVLFDARRAR